MPTPRVPRLPPDTLEAHGGGWGALAWSRDEFHAASEALARLMEETGDTGRGAGGPREGEVGPAVPDGEQVVLQRLAHWFGKRYRAHPPQVSILHFERFVAIWLFLDEYGERLRRDGVVGDDDELGMLVDEDLLAALVCVDYRRRSADPRWTPRIGRYAKIMTLARHMASGRVRGEEFVRIPPERREESGEQGSGAGPASSAVEEASSFELEDFENAMEAWYELKERPESELRAEASHLWSVLDTDLHETFGGSAATTLLIRWFAERFGDVPGVGGLMLRFMIMAGFIEQHLDRLVQMSLIEPRGDSYRLSGALFSVLNNLPLTPSGQGGAAPFDFDRVTALAEAHRELLGDRLVFERKTLGSRRNRRATTAAPEATPGAPPPGPARPRR